MCRLLEADPIPAPLIPAIPLSRPRSLSRPVSEWGWTGFQDGLDSTAATTIDSRNRREKPQSYPLAMRWDIRRTTSIPIGDAIRGISQVNGIEPSSAGVVPDQVRDHVEVEGSVQGAVGPTAPTHPLEW